MRFATINGRAALVTDDGYVDLHDASGGDLPSDALAALDRWEDVRTFASSAPPATGAFETSQLGAPVPNPRQVFALAANYRDHAAEAGIDLPEQPYVFTKFPSCIAGPHDDVLLGGHRVDWEVELVVVIGRRCKDVPLDQAWDVVAGLTVGQDISDRKVQFRKPFPHLAVSKSFPTYGPTGPWITTADELPDPAALPLRCSINDELMQDSTTEQLYFDVPALVASISSMVELLPGDLIFTGTPAGVGSTRDPRLYLKPGDVITSEIPGIGIMRNLCVEKG
ncbi:MAG: fumarylacetoacetate hydrolase family protein [Frankiaceae bacterium]|nr:fumarylacetoacetate hydrolase family protein [Frankiaceae bacterium]